MAAAWRRLDLGGMTGTLPFSHHGFAEAVAVIALVGQHGARIAGTSPQQSIDGLIIRGFAAGQDTSERASLTVRSGVDPAAKAAAISTKTLPYRLPPLAPAALRHGPGPSCRRPCPARCRVNPVRPGFPAQPATPLAPPNAGTGHRQSSTCRSVQPGRARDNRPAAQKACHQENADCHAADCHAADCHGKADTHSRAQPAKAARSLPILTPQVFAHAPASIKTGLEPHPHPIGNTSPLSTRPRLDVRSGI